MPTRNRYNEVLWPNVGITLSTLTLVQLNFHPAVYKLIGDCLYGNCKLVRPRLSLHSTHPQWGMRYRLNITALFCVITYSIMLQKKKKKWNKSGQRQPYPPRRGFFFLNGFTHTHTHWQYALRHLDAIIAWKFSSNRIRTVGGVAHRREGVAHRSSKV